MRVFVIRLTLVCAVQTQLLMLPDREPQCGQTARDWPFFYWKLPLPVVNQKVGFKPTHLAENIELYALTKANTFELL